MLYVPAGVYAVVDKSIVDCEEVPGDDVTTDGLNDAWRPMADDGNVAVRVIGPESPMLLTLTSEAAEPPAIGLAGEAELAEIVKSGVTTRVMLVVEERPPLVPVIVTVYVPDSVELVVPVVRVEGEDCPGWRDRTLGVKGSEGPLGAGELNVAVRVTCPENP